MKHIIDYYGVLGFSLIIILLSILFLCFNNYYKSLITLFINIKSNKIHNLLFFSFIFLYVAIVYILSFCKNHVYNQSLIYYKDYEERPLYDTLYSIIPYNKYSHIGSEIILTFFMLLFFYLIYKNQNAFALINFIILFSIIQIIRGFIFSLTLLPDASNNCTFSLIGGSCNDLLFSGHIGSVLLILLLIFKYNLISSKVNKNILLALFILMNIFILSSRNHYSIDLVIGIILTYAIYNFYFVHGEKMLSKLFN
jgi:hypothetical protein